MKERGSCFEFEFGRRFDVNIRSRRGKLRLDLNAEGCDEVLCNSLRHEMDHTLYHLIQAPKSNESGGLL